MARVLQRHSHMPVRAVAYSNTHGFNICTGADDGTVKFWTADKGELKGCIPAHVRESGGIRSVDCLGFEQADRGIGVWVHLHSLVLRVH